MVSGSGYKAKIEALIAPLLGDFIAEMAVKSQCKAIGITPETISASDLDALATKIGAALSFHGHRSDAPGVVQKIKALR